MAKDMNGVEREKYWASTKSVAFTATTARSSANFSAGVDEIRVVATQNCFIKLGDSTVEAATTDHYIAAGVPERLPIRSNTRIAAIRASADGTLYITELVP